MDREPMAVHVAAFERALSPEAKAWQAETLTRLGTEPSTTEVRIAFARAGRSLGQEPIDFVDGRIGVSRAVASWRACDVGRAALLLRIASIQPADAWAKLVTDLLRRGELSEQQSVLRMLSWLPDPARFVGIAIDACRTNSEPVFVAIACENPFPASHFPDHAFDQMVIKSIFLGIPVARIFGLADRVTSETARMASDLANERRAAGRPVPDDVGYVLSLSTATR